jgi:hypothetical protein
VWMANVARARERTSEDFVVVCGVGEEGKGEEGAERKERVPGDHVRRPERLNPRAENREWRERQSVREAGRVLRVALEW